ncbi:MAG: type II 3-dehydroquinate dehydratase [Tissierellales bacterium]|nr:type II 3-dehydroquinate dehydratase [Tissierellales bacterium]
MNKLGKRDPKIYGKETLSDIESSMKKLGEAKGFVLDFFQSNSEGDIIDKIHEYQDYNGIILNAGAYSHYSIAIRDAIEIATCPVIEVHLSNIYKREDFRKTSVISEVCLGQITGFGSLSYIMAIEAFARIFNE